MMPSRLIAVDLLDDAPGGSTGPLPISREADARPGGVGATVLDALHGTNDKP